MIIIIAVFESTNARSGKEQQWKSGGSKESRNSIFKSNKTPFCDQVHKGKKGKKNEGKSFIPTGGRVCFILHACGKERVTSKM